MIRPLWALIRDLGLRLWRLRPASARKLDSVCLEAETCSMDRLCLGIYACLDTKALTRNNRFAARQK